VDFIKLHLKETDIFCFQEVFEMVEGVPPRIKGSVRLTILSELYTILHEFELFTMPSQIFEGCSETLTIFVRKGIAAKDGGIPVYKHEGGTVNLQYACFSINNKKYTVCNFHGYWSPTGKGDLPGRFEQTKSIKEFLDSIDGEKILCGDFNMLPSNLCLSTLKLGMRDLITEYGIRSTRSGLYEGFERFADFIFVSKGVKVGGFSVTENVVSDHLPLMLEFF
jgi:hypothetical protein